MITVEREEEVPEEQPQKQIVQKGKNLLLAYKQGGPRNGRHRVGRLEMGLEMKKQKLVEHLS